MLASFLGRTCLLGAAGWYSDLPATRRGRYHLPPTRGVGYNLKPKHQTLRSLYNEWYGLGEFSTSFGGRGGIDGLEREQGASWRKHIKSHTFSRLKRIVTTIDQLKEASGGTAAEKLEVALRVLEPVFQESKRSTATMVVKLQSGGYLQKGNPRGIKRKRGE